MPLADNIRKPLLEWKNRDARWNIRHSVTDYRHRCDYYSTGRPSIADYNNQATANIAVATQKLNELRHNWRNPAEWVDWVRTHEEENAGYPARPVPKLGFDEVLKVCPRIPLLGRLPHLRCARRGGKRTVWFLMLLWPCVRVLPFPGHPRKPEPSQASHRPRCRRNMPDARTTACGKKS